MSPKISFWLLLQLAVLLAVVLAQSGNKPSYRNFAKQHIELWGPRRTNPSEYCNRMMKRRGMTKPVCKPNNTFIHGKPIGIRLICLRGRTSATSRRRYRVTICRSTRTFNGCSYYGRKEKRRIRVNCRKRRPVEFSGFA